MLKASKSDFIFEPIDLLVRFIIRLAAEGIETAIEKYFTHCSFAVWLIFLIFIVAFLIALALAIHQKSKKHP